MRDRKNICGTEWDPNSRKIRLKFAPKWAPSSPPNSPPKLSSEWLPPIHLQNGRCLARKQFGSHLGPIWVPFGSLFGPRFGPLFGPLLGPLIAGPTRSPHFGPLISDSKWCPLQNSLNELPNVRTKRYHYLGGADALVEALFKEQKNKFKSNLD